MSIFVLIPGAWLDGEVWQQVATDLERRGHRVLPVTLGTAPTDGLTEHTRQVGEVLAAADEPVVLVGHSYGSFPMLGAADRWPDRVARTVLIDAPLPEDGEALVDLLPCEQRATVTGELVPYPAVPWMSGGELPAGTSERLAERTPHWPARCMTEPIALTGAVKELPMTGVFCTLSGADLAVARGLHASGAPRFAWLANRANRYYELASGHLPMVTMPERLAEVLAGAARGEGEPLL
ncbi:alpha/beta fold hydrolase [Kitasatospora viridis]|uniref:Alpha/beta hydrolase family protein n=1 Tax=Kitasatospora viridis TaxID=281105 RepID=A0A561UMS4_9ACTN|nr:alpha/beta hydrolase family protein [Kitasatospora viridis]TWG00660.1 alpha/beta hydrolase family protein [Kitasatospora viridis]